MSPNRVEVVVVFSPIRTYTFFFLSELEWKLHKAGIVESTLEENPKPKVHDMMMSSIRSSHNANKEQDESSDDDY